MLSARAPRAEWSGGGASAQPERNGARGARADSTVREDVDPRPKAESPKASTARGGEAIFPEVRGGYAIFRGLRPISCLLPADVEIPPDGTNTKVFTELYFTNKN